MQSCFLFIFIFCTFYSTSANEYENIDKISMKVPDSVKSYTEIASFLTKNVDSEIMKARAIYIWITHNISYNLNQIEFEYIILSEDAYIQNTINTGTGVCRHYAQLFEEMTKSIGLNCYSISGYAKNEVEGISKEGHVWNVIQLESKYYALDPTWDAGYVQDGKYIQKFQDKFFLITSDEFLKTHLPFDYIWQLRNKPISYSQFCSKEKNENNFRDSISFLDSIGLYAKSNDIERVKYSLARIKTNKENTMLNKKTQEYYQNHLELLIYNDAIKKLNKGISLYNTYLKYKSVYFKRPPINDNDLLQLITEVKVSIFESYKILLELSQNGEKQKNTVQKIDIDFNKLRSEINKDYNFVVRYIDTKPIFRAFIFTSLN